MIDDGKADAGGVIEHLGDDGGDAITGAVSDVDFLNFRC